MRHRWYSTITLAVATLAVLAWSANPTFAQRGRAGRAGWGGGNWNGGWGWGGNGWYGNGWGWGNGYGWYGNGWYGDGYGSRGNWGYPYGYSWYQPYTYGYYNSPVYSDNISNSYGYNPTDQGYTSFYGGPAEEQNSAHIDVVVPANAQVFFDGEQTRQRGQFRRFVTPALDPGQSFTYDIKAVWDENGQKMEKSRKVHVRAGQQSSVDFMAMGRGRDMRGADYDRTDTYDRDRRYDRGDVDRDRVRDRTDMNRTDVDRNRDLNRDRTDMNRTDTERNRDLNRDRNDPNRNRTEPVPPPEPKDQNKPPAF